MEFKPCSVLEMEYGFHGAGLACGSPLTVGHGSIHCVRTEDGKQRVCYEYGKKPQDAANEQFEWEDKFIAEDRVIGLPQSKYMKIGELCVMPNFKRGASVTRSEYEVYAVLASLVEGHDFYSLPTAIAKLCANDAARISPYLSKRPSFLYRCDIAPEQTAPFMSSNSDKSAWGRGAGRTDGEDGRTYFLRLEWSRYKIQVFVSGYFTHEVEKDIMLRKKKTFFEWNPQAHRVPFGYMVGTFDGEIPPKYEYGIKCWCEANDWDFDGVCLEFDDGKYRGYLVKDPALGTDCFALEQKSDDGRIKRFFGGFSELYSRVKERVPQEAVSKKPPAAFAKIDTEDDGAHVTWQLKLLNLREQE